MTAPLAGVGAQQVSQIAQQKLQEQNQQPQVKQGESKFDQMMSQKADAARPPGTVQQANAPRQIEATRPVEQIGKTEKASLNKVTGKGMDPVTAKNEVGKLTSSMQKMVADLEKGQASLDKLISGSLSGKEFSHAELLGLQASMYKYSQELDLTSKLVEKATSGLKDTLKTQV